jgi:hypothetical protein
MTTPQSSDTLPLARVLAKRPGFFRTVQRGEYLGRVYDRSSLPFLMEEFVASAVVEVVVTAGSPAALHLNELPDVLRSRVSVVDTTSVRKQVAGLLAPLGAEFGFALDVASGSLSGNTPTPHEIVPVVGHFIGPLYDLLLGAQFRLQVDINLEQMKALLTTLQSFARSAEARGHLANLRGILSTYKSVKMPSLALTTAATDDQLERFRWFVEDVTYQHLSRDAGLLGIPEDGDRVLQRLERGVAALVKKPLFKPFAKAASKLISTAAHVEVDAGDLAVALLPTKYLPPIIPLDTAYARAEALWRSMRGPFVETDRTIAAMGSGWRETADLPQPSLGDFAGFLSSDHVPHS